MLLQMHYFFLSQYHWPIAVAMRWWTHGMRRLVCIASLHMCNLFFCFICLFSPSTMAAGRLFFAFATILPTPLFRLFCVYVCPCACVSVRAYVCVCVCVCVYPTWVLSVFLSLFFYPFVQLHFSFSFCLCLSLSNSFNKEKIEKAILHVRHVSGGVLEDNVIIAASIKLLHEHEHIPCAQR